MMRKKSERGGKWLLGKELKGAVGTIPVAACLKAVRGRSPPKRAGEENGVE